MAEHEEHLSRSMEDYLEAIYNLKQQMHIARVKDIARRMDVKMPSVSGALRSLAAKGLVRHQPYESVDLTEDGLLHARNIADRHSAVREFLISVLGLNEYDAESEACGIEHAIRPDTLDKLLKFIDFVRACSANETLRLEHFHHFTRHGFDPEGFNLPTPADQGPECRADTSAASLPLSEMCPGMRGRIRSVSGKGPIRKRLLDMGVSTGAALEILRTAPLGDPVEIRVRGYLLSLRKSEAEHIEVEVQ